MKYAVEIDIDLPRDRVIELFDSTENLFKWQPGLVSFDNLDGEPGQVGTKSRMHYKMGKREFDLIETITVRNLPEEFSGTYETDGVWNEVRNRFEASGPDRTRWTSENEFRCKGFLKLMAFLMPGMFRKESRKQMERFKEFAERAGTA